MGHDVFEWTGRAMRELSSMGYSQETLNAYQAASFDPLLRWCSEVGLYAIMACNLDEADAHYLREYELGRYSREALDRRFKGTAIIREIMATGSYKWKVNRHAGYIDASGPFEGHLDRFCDALDGSDQCRHDTEVIVRGFVRMITDIGVAGARDVAPEHVQSFLELRSKSCSSSMGRVVASLRKFLDFLEPEEGFDDDPRALLATPRSRDRRIQQPVTPAEFELVLGAIDRDDPAGKRDYAMLALVGTTGLRACDVAALELGDVNWRAGEIGIVQRKTAAPLTLPVKPPVLDAMADYILHARPDSESLRVFLRAQAPHVGLSGGGSVCCMFQRRLAAAGIERKPRDGKTVHGLRRMLATEMTAAGVQLDTVAQVLGHRGVHSVKSYISPGLDALRACFISLEEAQGASR